MVADDDEHATDFEVVEPADTAIPPAPVHPLSSLVTIVVDLIWAAPEVVATLTVAGLPALIVLIVTCISVCFVSVMLIQRYVDHDTWGAASAKASVMGIVAGVPYAVLGTVAGSLLLAWAGVHQVEPLVRQYLPPRSS